MKPFVLVAAAAMALASCQKNEMPAPEKQTVHFTVNAGIETKTSIVEGKDAEENIIYTPQWDGNEKLGLLFAAPNENTKAEHVITLTNEVSGSTASFQGEVENVEPTGTFYAFYPAEAFSRGYTEGDARLDLKNVQKPTATSFDPKCDILVAKPYDYSVEEGSVVANGLQFARIMSVLRIDLKSEFADVQNEFVESISFTAGDVNIAGYARIFLDNPDFTGKWASSGSQWCTVTANYDSDLVSINGDSNSVYLVIAPVTIPANKELTFEIKTKNYNISKTVMSPEMNFTAGNVSKINLTIEEANCEKIDQSIDYSGEYLIVNKDLTKAASKWSEGNNLPAVDLQTANGVVYETDNIADCKMTITKVTEGDNAGKYTIQDAAGKYLYAAGGIEKNYLKGQDTASYWTIEEKDGNFEITSTVADCTRNLLRYNSQNKLFSCYASGQNDVTLYKYSDIKVDTTPKISVTNKSYSALATDTSVEIPYTVKNITGAITATVADGATLTNVKATVADAKVTVTFDANTESTEKTATIVLSYEGAESVNVTVTQAAKPAEDAPAEVTDVLTLAITGVSGTSYSSWSGKTVTSSAVYAGQSAGDKSSIQLRSKNNNSGVVTTTSGGKVKKVKVTWNTGTTSGRVLDVYGKNTAYTDAADLYNASIAGTKLGSIKYGESTELEVAGDYQYVGLRSQDGAMYLTDISITWSTESGSGVTPEPEEPETPVDPTPDPEPETNGYTKYTGELVEGDYIIVYDGVAMNTTVSSDRLQYTAVSPVNDVISDPAETIVWHIAKSGDYWTIYNASANKYAASTGAKNKAQMLASGTDNKSLWTVSGTNTYEFVNKQNKVNGVNSNLRRNGTYGFACYATSTGGSLTLYKKN